MAKGISKFGWTLASKCSSTTGSPCKSIIPVSPPATAARGPLPIGCESTWKLNRPTKNLSIHGWRDHLLGRTAAPRIQSLAVLPLENLSGDPAQEYFADGMTEELITDLSQISALRVISRTSVMQYKGTKKHLPEIARELNVDAVLEGSVLRSDDRVRITAQLIQANPENHLWAESYERRLRDVLALQSEVAQEIANKIQIKLTKQQQTQLANSRAVNPDAHDLYLKGRYEWNKRTEPGLNKGIEYFQQAIAIQPDYAAAYAGLADSYQLLANNRFLPISDTYPKAKAAALKALEIDPDLPDAQAIYRADGWRRDNGARPELHRARADHIRHRSLHRGVGRLLAGLIYCLERLEFCHGD